MKKRKIEDGEEHRESVPSTTASRQVIVDTSMDIFEDVGKYVPPESVEDRATVASMHHQDVSANIGKDISSVPPAAVMVNTIPAAGTGHATPKMGSAIAPYFSNLRAVSTTTAGDEATVDNPSTDDLMAPVKAVWKAQAMKAAAVKRRYEVSEDDADDSWGGGGAAANDMSEGKVHRDVFGALGADAKKRGAAMGVGTYDLYPETADYEVNHSRYGLVYMILVLCMVFVFVFLFFLLVSAL